jgi:DNA-binding Lrp family transcriptional regulator
LVTVSLSENVNAAPDEVFTFLNNFERAPEFSSIWKSVKLVKRVGNTSVYDTVAQVEGQRMKSVTRIISRSVEAIDAETVDGDGKGTKISFIIRAVPTGTQLTLEGTIVPPGFAKMLGVLLKGKIESGMKRELAVIKNAVEVKPSGL